MWYTVSYQSKRGSIMIKVQVNASKQYDILIGKGILQNAGEYIKNIKAQCRVAVISDDKVFKIYGKAVTASLEKAGFEVYSHIFPNGEKSKTLKTYGKIMTFLADNLITRTDLILALGGGVVGDIAGFCAATYLRGIEFVQLPTSLLAAVDSSVGGKTAVDLPNGKNLVGAFHQPSLVVCDIKCFDTLDKRQIASGFAEVIKYGVMCDEEFFEVLEAGKDTLDMEKVVERCVSIKRDIVNQDEFESGKRMLLNLGHTLGHAVETHSMFDLTHGEAVSIGMMMISLMSQRGGYATENFCDRLNDILVKYNLPVDYDILDEELYLFACEDKKKNGNTITLVMPKKIGECELVKMPLSELEEKIPLCF